MSNNCKQIVVRAYHSKDFKDLGDSGYVFSLQSFYSGEIFRDLKTKALKALGGIEEEHLVAFHVDQKKAVGFTTVRKITDTLFGIWNIFVHPDFRRRGIASLLYRSSFEYLAKMSVKKALGSVAVDNIASVRSVARTFDRFLDQRFYYIPNVGSKLAILPHHRSEVCNFSISHLGEELRDSLFATYKNCFSEDWRSFLEINRENFLERFIDFPLYSKGLLSLISDNHAFFTKDKLAEGYIAMIGPKMCRSATLHLCIPEGSPDKTANLLLLKVIQELRLKRKKASMLCVTNDELQLQRILSKFDLHPIPHQMPIKYL